MSDLQRVEMVLEWAEEHPSFDTEFVESLRTWLDTRETLTPKQRAALENIIVSCDIE
jgi:hypothetical protein